MNLNNIQPGSDGSDPTTANRDNSIDTVDGSASVYFRNLVPSLVSHIDQADVVLGCVAWLTHPEVLDALIGKETAIVVQKEDFLRPESVSNEDLKAALKAQYGRLSCQLNRFVFSNMIGALSTCADPSIDPVRCVGNFNREQTPSFPRMHNKFLILAKLVNYIPHPYAVWTGSLNLTACSALSLENAVVLSNAQIVNAYYQEFGQIWALSEPLNWEADWISPEFRLGT